MVAHPTQADELMALLEADQAEIRATGQAYFHETNPEKLDAHRTRLRQNTQQRTKRMLRILNEVGEPSLVNIGAEAAQAMSVLALHADKETLRKVLDAFNVLYAKDKGNTYYQAIPSMTDLLLLLECRPQHFGTQWMFDANKQPFLPTVEDFAHVNERRTEYGIEPLRWPKSLAIPESEQPWLKRPLTELVMREPTEAEYAELSA